MALSRDEQALADASYARLQHWNKYRYGAGGSFLGAIAASPSIFRVICDPHASHRTVAFFSILWGMLLGATVTWSYAVTRRRKQDERVVRFFEQRFPGECSWKQEEQILSEAEDIRLKAKVDSLIQKAAR